MWYNIFKFELQYRKKRPATYIYFALTFISVLLIISSPVMSKMGAAGLIKENAPVVISYFMTKVSLFMALLASAIMGVPVLRDYEYKTESLMFVNPIKKRDYLLGRFLGSFVVLLIISLSVPLAGMLAELMPWRNPDNILPFNAGTYINSYISVILPNIFFMGVLFFAGGSLSKKNIVVYTQGIFLIVFMMMAQALITKIDNRLFASILDPFGGVAIKNEIMYWSVSDRNGLMLPFSGGILYNRIAWIYLAAGALIITLRRFNFNISKVSTKETSSKKALKSKLDIQIKTPKVEAQYGSKYSFIKLWHLSKFYTSYLFKEVSFIAIIISGLALLIVKSFDVGFQHGTVVYPTTYTVINMLNLFQLFFMMILVFFSGELIWKERNIKFSPIYDSLPVPDMLSISGKFFGLVLSYIILLFSLIVMGVIIQLAYGYTNIELGLYFTTMFSETFLFIVFYTLFTFFIMAIVNHKFMAYGLVLLFFVVIDLIPELGLDHRMLQFAEVSLGSYSDMNKYGHYVQPFVFGNLYWLGFSALLFIASIYFSSRGMDTLLKDRIKRGKYRITRPIRILGMSSFTLFMLTGGYIFYNTNIQNEHITDKEFDKYLADYEKNLSQYDYAPQPKIVDVNLEVEIYPKQRNFTAKGKYILVNKSDKPIEDIHIQSALEKDVSLTSLSFENEYTIEKDFTEYKFTIYKLKKALNPGDSLKLNFRLSFDTKGFVDQNSNTNIVENGTFFNSFYFPKIGYNSDYELDEDRKRKKYDLVIKERMLSRDDPRGYTNPPFGNNLGHINFEIVIGTSKDQTAIAPGYLIDQWEKDRRNYFHYKMDRPILNFYSIVSARYEVLKEEWNGINLEIYYHDEHKYNLDRMMLGMKKSLEYYTKAFGPYQYRQLRIMEFPRYESFAQSFSNTIPFSEAIGFIMDVDKSVYDTPFFITAHEVGHQWWAHQVCEANTKGSTFQSEAITQYSAMMAYKHAYPDFDMSKYLRYELDKYLRGRAREEKKEMPLIDVENQDYIHYRKGALIMYAFQDYIGEENINKALRSYLAKWKYREDRYPTSEDLLDEFRKVTPDSLQYLIRDFFEDITFYDNKTNKVEAQKLPNGNYQLTIDFESQKLKADCLGSETDTDINDWIEVGVFGENDALIYLQKHKVNQKKNSLSLILNEKPLRAGIDPLIKLIDRQPDDNSKKVIHN